MNKKLIIIVILLLFVMSGAVYTYTLNGSSFKNIFGIRPDPPAIPYHFDNSIKGNLFEDKTHSSFSTFTNSRANISFELYNPDQIDLPLEPLVNISVIERGSLQNFTSDGTLGVAFFSRLPGLRMCRIYIYTMIISDLPMVLMIINQFSKEDFCNSINLDPDGIECLAVICYFAGYCK